MNPIDLRKWIDKRWTCLIQLAAFHDVKDPWHAVYGPVVVAPCGGAPVSAFGEPL